jgi:hypothetical protein
VKFDYEGEVKAGLQLVKPRDLEVVQVSESFETGRDCSKRQSGMESLPARHDRHAVSLPVSEADL